MNRPCSAPGCIEAVSSRFSRYCPTHKTRQRRHGDAIQYGITATDLKPFLAKVRKRIAKNPDSPAWKQLEGRWAAILEYGRGVLDAYERGRANSIYVRKAAHEALNIATAAEPAKVTETALAVYVMWELEPRHFVSDASFKVQLVRRVRALADVSAGQYFDHKSGKTRRVYRDLSPRAVTVLAEWLGQAFGVAGLKLGKMERADEEKLKEEKKGLYRALEELE